ncbi:MAG: hypothetical protein J7599_00835 [Niabella sp.]|nr:hypothetical protein [Niabella sp.]
MRLVNFFKKNREKAALKNEDEALRYLPSFCEDDYCQIEIVPYANKEYILKTFKQIEKLANNSKTDFGFTEIYGRRQMPVTTFCKETRIHYLEALLSGFEFEKAKSINYNSQKILDCEVGPIKGHGFSAFTIFFDTEDVFVKNIWLSISLIVDVKQYGLVESALHCLGEDCDMTLVDWNSLKLFDLKDRKQVNEYLMDYWK